MSWLFSRALVEVFSDATCSDGARSALSNGNPTPQAFLPPDRMTAFSRPSRFGMTFAPLTDSLGAGLLTWFRGDFLAKTSASQERATDLTGSDPASGPKWRGSLAKYDPDMRSWRTAQRSLLGDSEESLETWPRWGTTVDGELYLLPIPALPMRENASGCWPTPTTRDRGSDAPNRAGGPSLGVAVRNWPTPTAHNSKEGAHPSEHGRNTATLTAQAAGGIPTQPMTLNPEWVEWLQGWPRAWTDLKPLETDKSHKPQHSHGEH
jgi:hypothetical protein